MESEKPKISQGVSSRREDTSFDRTWVSQLNLLRLQRPITSICGIRSTARARMRRLDRELLGQRNLREQLLR